MIRKHQRLVSGFRMGVPDLKAALPAAPVKVIPQIISLTAVASLALIMWLWREIIMEPILDEIVFLAPPNLEIIKWILIIFKFNHSLTNFFKSFLIKKKSCNHQFNQFQENNYSEQKKSWKNSVKIIHFTNL